MFLVSKHQPTTANNGHCARAVNQDISALENKRENQAIHTASNGFFKATGNSTGAFWSTSPRNRRKVPGPFYTLSNTCGTSQSCSQTLKLLIYSETESVCSMGQKCLMLVSCFWRYGIIGQHWNNPQWRFGHQEWFGWPCCWWQLTAALVGFAMFLIMLLGISDDNQYGTVYNGITMVISNTD